MKFMFARIYDALEDRVCKNVGWLHQLTWFGFIYIWIMVQLSRLVFQDCIDHWQRWQMECTQ